jgi:CHASE3 domain sensor protein
MRLTIANKLRLGFGLLVLLLVMTVLLVEWGLGRIAHRFTEVATVQEPLNAAAYEMEINAIGTGLGVFQYLETGDPFYRAQLEKDQADFARFRAQYDRLARVPQARELGDRLSRLYKKFQGWGEALMRARDQQTTLWETLVEYTQAIDTLLDEYGGNLLPEDPQEVSKRFVAVRLETALAEIETRLWHYLRQSQPAYEARIFDKSDEFQQQLRRFAAMPLTTVEQGLVSDLTARFEQLRSCIHEMLVLHASQQQELLKFLALRADMDDILHNQIQVLAFQNLREADHDAQQTVQQVRLLLLGLFVVGLLVGGGVAVVIGRGIHRAVRALVDGAEAVG